MSGYENKVKELHPELDILHIPKYVVDKAIVKNRYGKCKIALNTLLKGGKPTLLNAIDKTKYFVMQVYYRNEYFRKGDFAITGEYRGQKDKIEITTVYGKCLADVVSLWQGYMPRIPTAIDKNEYFKRMVWNKNKYYRSGKFKILGDYERGDKHILLEDKYGLLRMRPSAILNGNENTIFSAVDKTAYWVNKAKEVHGNKYDYTNSEYVSTIKYIDIICKEHGSFEQTPSNHLKGNGCPMCSREVDRGGWSYSGWEHLGVKSENFDSYKVYIIKCWDEDTGEEFYKVGKTMQKLKNRFDYVKLMPYEYEIILKVESNDNDCQSINKLENKIKKVLKEHKHTPNKTFQGYTECFSKIDLSSFYKQISNLNSHTVVFP